MKTYATRKNAVRAARAVIQLAESWPQIEGDVDYVIIATADGRFSPFFACSFAGDVIPLTMQCDYPVTHGNFPLGIRETQLEN